MGKRALHIFDEEVKGKRRLHIFKEEEVQPVVEEYKDPMIVGNTCRDTRNKDYTNYKTHRYVQKYAEAIRQDLGIYFELLVGKPVSIWRINKDGNRCNTCTDPVTGAVLMTACPSCGGIGYTPPFIHVIDTNAILQYNPKQTSAAYTGNSEVATDQLVIIGNNIIDDRDLVYMYDTGDIYLVDTQQPDITALMGEVITQIAIVSRMPEGDKRYHILTKLIKDKKEAEERLDAKKARLEKI